MNIMKKRVKAYTEQNFSLVIFVLFNYSTIKSNKKCHKHVTNAPKGIGLAQDTFEERQL